MKSELAALDRKIQLELAPPTPEVVEKEKNGQEVKAPSLQQFHSIPDGIGTTSGSRYATAVSEPSETVPYNRHSTGKFRL